MTVEREGRAMKAMAPVFDMFNHDPGSSTVHGFQESNQVRPLCSETAAAVGKLLSPRVSRQGSDEGRVFPDKSSRPLLVLLCPCLHPLGLHPDRAAN